MLCIKFLTIALSISYVATNGTFQEKSRRYLFNHGDKPESNTYTVQSHCSRNPCEHGTCSETHDRKSYTCHCQFGWIGRHCDQVVTSHCSPDPCLHGTCSETPDRHDYSCRCYFRWTGRHCDQVFHIDHCDNHPCHNGATCTSGIHGYICHCQQGWSGINCDWPSTDTQSIVNPCINNPCHHGAQCISDQNTYTCHCLDGWTGQYCETDVDECASHPCMHGSTCNNTEGSYTCTCPSGWTGDQCQYDVDECASHLCMHGSTCTNTQGSYTCTCPSGWTGDQCQYGKPDECDNVCTLQSVVKSSAVVDTNAGICSGSGQHSSNEALLMKCCYLQNSANWTQGQPVMEFCKSGATTSYKPVAIFTNGVLQPDTAGVFTGCLLPSDNGFKMIRQTCSTSPHVYYVNGTNADPMEKNPSNYFFVL